MVLLPPPRKVLASPEMLPRVTRRASFSSGFRPSSAPDAPPFNRRDPSGAPNGWTLRTPKRSTTLLPSRLGASVPAGPRGARALGGFTPDPGRAPPRPHPGLSPTCTPRAVIPRRGSAARSRLVPSGLPSAALPGPRLPTLDLFPGAGRGGAGRGRGGRNCCPRAAGRAGPLPARRGSVCAESAGPPEEPPGRRGARTRPEGEARAPGEG